MEYFILKNSKKMSRPLEISTVTNDFSVVDGCMMLKAKIEAVTTIPDFLVVNKMFSYFYFVSVPLYELLKDYIGDVEEIVVPVTDLESGRQAVFYSVPIEKVEGGNLMHGAQANSLVLRKSHIPNPFIFRAELDKKEYLIISLHLAEHMLRCNVYGIELEKIRVIMEEE